MLEKIGTPGYETISTPDQTVLRMIGECLQSVEAPVYYEIGVGIGATAVEVARRMSNRGRMFFFSREKDVRELASDLAREGFFNVDAEWGSPPNAFSGYHFELARGFLGNSLPSFDLAYVDGAHLLHFDGPATCVLKELCKPGGHMVFDDWSWSLERSAAFNPQTRPRTAVEYDARQISACHVQIVCRTIMDTDPRFRLLVVERDSAVYRRVE